MWGRRKGGLRGAAGACESGKKTLGCWLRGCGSRQKGSRGHRLADAWSSLLIVCDIPGTFKTLQELGFVSAKSSNACVLPDWSQRWRKLGCSESPSGARGLLISTNARY